MKNDEESSAGKPSCRPLPIRWTCSRTLVQRAVLVNVTVRGGFQNPPLQQPVRVEFALLLVQV